MTNSNKQLERVDVDTHISGFLLLTLYCFIITVSVSKKISS